MSDQTYRCPTCAWPHDCLNCPDPNDQAKHTSGCSDEVRECPFCGSDQFGGNLWAVICESCGASGPEIDCSDGSGPPADGESIAAWNRRALPSPAPSAFEHANVSPMALSKPHNLIHLQNLLNAGLNAFAAELLGESIVQMDSAIPIDFTLRIRKGKAFNAVRFQLTPVNLIEGVPPEV